MKKWSFPTRLFALYSLIVFLVIPLSYIVLYQYYKSVAYKSLSESFYWEVTTLAEQLDSVIVSLDGLAVHTLSNPSIENWMKETPDANSNSKVINVFNKMRLDLDIDPDSLNRISIIKDTGTFLTFGSSSYNREQARKKIAGLSWFGDVEHKPLLVLPPHRDDWDSKGKMVVSVIRSGVPGTLIEVQIPFSYLEAMLFKDSPATSGKHIALYDAGGEMIYPAQMEALPEGQYMTADSTISHAGWRLAASQPIDVLLRPVRETGYWMAAIAGGLSLLLLVMVYFITSRMTRPLVRLSQAMGQVPGNADTSAQLSRLFEGMDSRETHDEVVRLYHAFKGMLGRMEESKQQAVEARSRELQAQFRALQTQMNPHFLYNTLTLIGMLGVEKGNDEILTMTSELVHMLRYITYDSRELVTLKDEVEHARRYLDIMKTRYRDHLAVDVQLNGDLSRVRLPKLTVQPFLENCFKHGFAGKKYPWRIRLTAMASHAGWEVRITDDGDGFRPDYVERFEAARSEGELDVFAEGGGLGLLNTYIRLRHTFGERLRFELSNAPDGGASVYFGIRSGELTDVEIIAG